MKLTIKKGRLSNDSELLFDLDKTCFSRPFDLPAKSVEDVNKYLKNATIYLCFCNRKVVGSFSYKEKEDNSIEFLQIMVLPEYQNKGIGKYMTKKMLEFTKGKDIYTATHPKNVTAIILYLKNGFQIYGWSDDCYKDGQPRLLLKLDK